MGKNIIRLNESQIKRIIKESVKRILRESNERKFHHYAEVEAEDLLEEMLKGGCKNPRFNEIWDWFYKENDAGAVEFGFNVEERLWQSDWDYWYGGREPEVDGYDITELECLDKNFMTLVNSCPYITPDMLVCDVEDAFCNLFENEKVMW